MILIQLAVLVFVILFGIPSQIIDFKHRRKGAYLPGNEWDYYSTLSKTGSLEGKFMMWSAYGGISLIIATVSYLGYRLFTT
ncbi:hypothetical protein SAMN02982985_05344 [Rugamonas rubra]|uniref:Uncharacterized protein n=1 Tax=Rugamonas rubra TaxID=758825 RepID=A0A1I4TT91_9BURK|nr:hypothetical protein SAMN02982985_05344 [Rugamonas rubra]